MKLGFIDQSKTPENNYKNPWEIASVGCCFGCTALASEAAMRCLLNTCVPQAEKEVLRDTGERQLTGEEAYKTTWL